MSICNSHNHINQNLFFPKYKTDLTQDFNFHWLAAIELCHTLNLCEGDIISTLKAMTSLIQTRHNPCTVLERPRVSNF